ncbi:MAG: glycosyltransferase family 2 protein [Paludibacter sp.]|nr:glycosyltransferase family 2 protein [Paludibacter sp.]
MPDSQHTIVSIIIPAYNAEKYLEETVASAMASIYPFVEIIIVNDGSTDKTQQIIEKITTENPQIKSFIQSNQGVSVARNFGISKSNGTYILPLDADDLISKDYIKKAVDVFENNDSVKLVYGEAERFGERTGKWELPAFDIKLLARRNIIYISAIFKKSDFEKSLGFTSEIKGTEDWDFWISILKRGGDVIQIPETCFYYRIHKGSKRENDKKNKKKDIDVLNKRHKAFYYRQLGGKLHYNRSWSVLFNKFSKILVSETFNVNRQFQLFDEVVYAANADVSIRNLHIELANKTTDGKVSFTEFEEKSFHFPCFRKHNSIASNLFLNNENPKNVIYLGFYEKQISFFKTKSILVTLEKVL